MSGESFLNGRVTLHAGDSRDVLKTIPDCSIDSIVTDPPYALVSIVKRFANSPRSERTENTENPYGRTGRGFMGQRWDTGETAFAVDFWAECLRVLKPGGHVVSFSGTRTVHRMVCAIEDAGFEIRDSLYWHYGSGLPKSHDVSKGIDKAGGTSPRDQAASLRQRREAAGLSRDELAAAVGCTVSSVRDWEEGRARAVGRAVEWLIPSEDYRAKLADLLGYSADERELIGISIDRRDDATVIGLGHSGALRKGGNTDASREWEGWGTALKPATEPVCLARKPLIGTVVANVLEHGTGAINIDGCRVGYEDSANPATNPLARKRGGYLQRHGDDANSVVWKIKDGQSDSVAHDKGRWPANIIHDGSDEVLAAFPDAGGAFAPVSGAEPSSVTSGVYGKRSRVPSRAGEASAERRYTSEGSTNFAALPGERRNDAGSAARFFYTAKADADDRLGSKHPTVKPVDLMQWLCRLVTPPGGTVLDPFAGTGTTAEAAFREGFNAVLIEREPEYQADIRRRMALCMAGPEERKRESIKAKVGDVPFEAGSLFAAIQGQAAE